MAKIQQTSRRAFAIRIVISAAVVAAASVVLAHNWAVVRSSLQTATQADAGWLAVALLLMAATFVTAAGIYGVLALHHLRYRKTVLVEVATAFVNKLLPAGIGGLGLHGLYLYKRKHTPAEATVVVSMNNLLGITAHLLLLLAVGLAQPHVIRQLLERQSLSGYWLLALAVPIVVVTTVPALRRRLSRFGHNLLASIRKLRIRSVMRATLLALLLTGTYTSILFASVQSVGINLNILQIFIVFSVGMFASTATPTPGGLVGAEAGLFAGLMAYGVASPAAGAAVILYRLVTYWLPLVPGAVALLLARRSKVV